MLPFLLALTVPVSTVALLHARREYRERGKLTARGMVLLCVMLFVPNLALEYATTYQVPNTLLDLLGVLVGGAGLALCLIGVIFFRSVGKVFGLDAGKLTTAGPYRWSRNPQYVGYFLFLLGFALNDWSIWCLAALLAVASCLHLLVLVEEEHLRRICGQQYVEFCLDVPRYASWCGRSTRRIPRKDRLAIAEGRSAQKAQVTPMTPNNSMQRTAFRRR